MPRRNGLLLALPLAAWANAEPSPDVARIGAEVPAPAAVYCIPSDDRVTLNWARVPGAAGYQVWSRQVEETDEGGKPEWVVRERVGPDRGRLSASRTGGPLPKLAVSTLFLERDNVVSSRPIPAVFLPAPGSAGEEMPPPFHFPGWAIPQDRAEAEFYRERREDALIGLILQQGFRFTRRVFLAGKSKLMPDNPDTGQPAPGEPPATDPRESG